jgi:transposase-like protein
VLRDEKAASSSRPYLVTDTVMADTLFQANMQTALRPFMGHTRTITEAAAITGIKANTLYVWVRRLVKLGLLRVVGKKIRAGRSIKLYQAVDQQFFIPLDVLSAETLERALSQLAFEEDNELYRHIAKAFTPDEERFGWLFVHAENDQLWFHAALYPGTRIDNLPPHRPAVINTGDELYLNFEDAKAFQKELLGLYKKYKKKVGAQAYLFRLALVPKQE